MRIILVSPKSSFTDQLKNSFQSNGTELFYLDDRNVYFLPKFLGNNRIIWRLVRNIQFLRVLRNRSFSKKLLREVENFKPDMVFFSKVMIIKKDTLLKLKDLNVKTANWNLENMNREPYKSWFLDNYKLYDYFFIFDSGARGMVINEPESKKIFYLPMAIDPGAYNIKDLPDSDIKKYSCDVCFVGAFYPEREIFLRAVKNMGVNLKIYGWKGWERSSLASDYFGPLNIIESSKLYKCAKICLNINLYPPVKGVNFKTFEIAAAGGFQLSDFREDLKELFVIGKEIEIFKDKNDLIEKINFYLENNNLRKGIAEAGKKRVFKDHTFNQRVQQILKIISV